MAASGTQITALHWETLDTEGPTRAEYQANWAAMDAHIHDGRGAGAPVRTITNATVPAASGDVRVNADAFQWYGTSLHTAADLATAQTFQNKTLDSTCTVSMANPTDILAVPHGGTGRAAADAAYGVVCAGTTATGSFSMIVPGTAGQLLQSGGSGAYPSWTSGNLAGDVTGTIGATTIAAGVVTGAKIASATITASKLNLATATNVLVSSVTCVNQNQFYQAAQVTGLSGKYLVIGRVVLTATNGAVCTVRIDDGTNVYDFAQVFVVGSAGLNPVPMTVMALVTNPVGGVLEITVADTSHSTNTVILGGQPYSQIIAVPIG